MSWVQILNQHHLVLLTAWCFWAQILKNGNNDSSRADCREKLQTTFVKFVAQDRDPRTLSMVWLSLELLIRWKFYKHCLRKNFPREGSVFLSILATHPNHVKWFSKGIGLVFLSWWLSSVSCMWCPRICAFQSASGDSDAPSGLTQRNEFPCVEFQALGGVLEVVEVRFARQGGLFSGNSEVSHILWLSRSFMGMLETIPFCLFSSFLQQWRQTVEPRRWGLGYRCPHFPVLWQAHPTFPHSASRTLPRITALEGGFFPICSLLLPSLIRVLSSFSPFCPAHIVHFAWWCLTSVPGSDPRKISCLNGKMWILLFSAYSLHRQLPPHPQWNWVWHLKTKTLILLIVPVDFASGG